MISPVAGFLWHTVFFRSESSQNKISYNFKWENISKYFAKKVFDLYQRLESQYNVTREHSAYQYETQCKRGKCLPFVIRSAWAVAFRLVITTIYLCSVSDLCNRRQVLSVAYNYVTSLGSRGFRTIQDILWSLRNIVKIRTLTRMSCTPYKKVFFSFNFNLATLMCTDRYGFTGLCLKTSVQMNQQLSWHVCMMQLHFGYRTVNVLLKFGSLELKDNSWCTGTWKKTQVSSVCWTQSRSARPRLQPVFVKFCQNMTLTYSKECRSEVLNIILTLLKATLRATVNSMS
jgi:hypothetical protein